MNHENGTKNQKQKKQMMSQNPQPITIKATVVADKQKYNSGLHAEGIVVRPSHYPKSRASRRPLGFKLINRNYND